MGLQKELEAKNLDGVIRELTENPSCIDDVTEKGVPLALYAAELGDFSIVKYIVEYSRASMNTVDENHRNILHYAAASGNLEMNRYLVEKVGIAVAEEMEEFHIDLWLAPGLNIQRNPLCGRNFEYYSEDPLLSGTMAAAMTKGVQSRPGCGVTVKHFACNNQEDNRMGVDAQVSERALREIYLRGFEIAVKESRPVAIMSSYNLLNGVHAANSVDLCTAIARKEWGFDGVIMSDWNTTVPEDGSIPWKCVTAGNDIIMPGNADDAENIRKAFEDGKLSEEVVRMCAGRILNLIHTLTAE